DRPAGVQCRLAYEHRQRRLARADVAHEPQPSAGVEVGVEVGDVAAHLARDRGRDLGDGRAVERHASVAPRDDRRQAAGPRPGHALRPAPARRSLARLFVDDEAVAVAQVEGAAGAPALRNGPQSGYASPWKWR